MATVSRRRGKWVADYRDGTGRRHWETHETRRGAIDALAQHVTALRNGRYVPPNNKRTVREAFESWWSLGVEGDDNRGGVPLRLATRAIYRLTWRVHVEPVWAARKLSTIRTEEVAQWRQQMLSGGVGPRTVHNSLLMLSFLCKHARRFRWIPANPCGEVRKPKFRVKVRAFTAAEVAILTCHADDATRVLIQTAAHTGLRIGELAGLEWSCVDLEKSEIHVEKQFTHELGELENGKQSTSCTHRQGIIERAHAASRAQSRPTRFPRSKRNTAALPQLALARVGAAPEAIARIGKFSHAAAFFCHSDAAGGRQRESGSDACGPSLGGFYTRRLRGCPTPANG